MNVPTNSVQALALLQTLEQNIVLLKNGDWVPDDASCDASLEVILALVQYMNKSCIAKIDWALFKAQKMVLVLLIENHKITSEEVLALDGVINMMGVIQDEFMPENEVPNESS